MADRVGQQLGNYRLTRLLGRGGFAEVYLGEHLRLNTQAAIKVLHTQIADEDADDFQREAQIIAALVHPHIVRVFDFDVKDGVPFLVMDYAPEGSLRRLHPKGSVVSLPTIVSYVKQVADALQYAHDQKLIHRDIKPENMLIGRRNEVLLIIGLILATIFNLLLDLLYASLIMLAIFTLIVRTLQLAKQPIKRYSLSGGTVVLLLVIIGSIFAAILSVWYGGLRLLPVILAITILIVTNVQLTKRYESIGGIVILLSLIIEFLAGGSLYVSLIILIALTLIVTTAQLPSMAASASPVKERS